MSTTTNALSVITIQDLSAESIWLFVSDSVTEILGYDPRELVGKSSFTLVHPQELVAAKSSYYETVRQDKAATLTVCRLRHRITGQYTLCFISATVVHNAIIGSISVATHGPKAMLKASTASDVIVLTPNVNLPFRKWTNPDPAVSNRPSSVPFDRPSSVPFDRLPVPSIRVGLILNRFSRSCQIIHCTNDRLLSPNLVSGRSIYDFVAKRDEELVRSHVDMAKAWGSSDNGEESCDGGFGYARFTLLLHGRNSSAAQSEPSSPHGRRGSDGSSSGSSPRSSQSAGRNESELPVDAIFSAHSDGLVVILRTA